ISRALDRPARPDPSARATSQTPVPRSATQASIMRVPHNQTQPPPQPDMWSPHQPSRCWANVATHSAVVILASHLPRPGGTPTAPPGASGPSDTRTRVQCRSRRDGAARWRTASAAGTSTGSPLRRPPRPRSSARRRGLRAVRAGDVGTVTPVHVVLRPQGLTRDEVVAVARDGAGAVLSDEARATMAATRAHVEAMDAGDDPVYGISTGFGGLATTQIPRARRDRLQRSLIASHAAG